MKRIKPLNDYADSKIALSNYCQGFDISYDQLGIGITNLHHILYKKGVCKNDHIILDEKDSAVWAIKLAAIVTYGAVAVTVPSNINAEERANIIAQSDVKASLDEVNDLSQLLCADHMHPVYIDIDKFSDSDDIVINYCRSYSGHMQPTTTKVKEFMQLADEIRARYARLRHSRLPSMLLANQACIDPLEVLASLSIGAHVTLAGSQPSSGTLLKCLKHYRPHFVYLDARTAEKLIRERIFPMLHPDTPAYMMNSITRRNLLKQARKRMMFALGGCILMVCVTGGKFSPDIQSFLQRIDFPYQVL